MLVALKIKISKVIVSLLQIYRYTFVTLYSDLGLIQLLDRAINFDGKLFNVGLDRIFQDVIFIVLKFHILHELCWFDILTIGWCYFDRGIG